MQWNEVVRFDVKGNIIVIKDAMIMLCSDEIAPEWPSIQCTPGEYVLEIFVPKPFNAHRVRFRRAGTDPQRGEQLGNVDVDHAFVAFIDYEPFLEAVRDDPDAYEEWTMGELDDELAINFSGELEFADTRLTYVKSAGGDGSFPVFELLQDGRSVGMECVLVD